MFLLRIALFYVVSVKELEACSVEKKYKPSGSQTGHPKFESSTRLATLVCIAFWPFFLPGGHFNPPKSTFRGAVIREIFSIKKKIALYVTCYIPQQSFGSVFVK